MFRIEPGDLVWRYWTGTLFLLLAGACGYAPAFSAAVVLSAAQLMHFLWREGRVAAFPVQVRMAYLGLLAIGQYPPLQWVYWIPLMGTTAMVLFGYCLLARLLSLAPWNRRTPNSVALLRRTLFSSPVEGSILDLLPPGEFSTGASEAHRTACFQRERKGARP